MQPSKRQDGFTLIELTAVLLVMGLIAGVVCMKTAGPMASATLGDACREAAFFDAAARRHARARGLEVRLVVDLTEESLQRLTDAPGAQPGRLDLAGRADLQQLIVGADDYRAGSYAVAVGPTGVSDSYAMRLGRRGAGPRWMVICGATGSMSFVQDEATAREILQATTGRHDAH